MLRRRSSIRGSKPRRLPHRGGGHSHLWKIGGTGDLPAIADARETYVSPPEAPAKDDSRAISIDRGSNRVRHRVEEVGIRTATDTAKDELERSYAWLSAFTRRAHNRIGERRRHEPARGLSVAAFQRLVEPSNGPTRLALVSILAAGSEASKTGE
jgi:hypothetical protein